MTQPRLVVAPDTAFYEGTPALAKVEAAVVEQGTVNTVQWEFRDRNGNPVDLSGAFPSPLDPECTCDYTSASFPCTVPPEPSSAHGGSPHSRPVFDPPGTSIGDIVKHLSGHNKHPENPPQQIGSHPPREQNKGEWLSDWEKHSQFKFEIRIQPADEPPKPIWIVPAQVYDPERGQIRFQIPHKVSDLGGIFVLNIGLIDKRQQHPIYVHRGLLSVERSAWGTHRLKMPTLSEIRMRLMDTPQENMFNGYVEFTTADILDSVVSAVREWNGTTPQLRRFTFHVFNFPWIEPWLWKITASLYQKAAMRYMRNKLQVNHGGIQGDDLNRDRDYLLIAKEFDEKWKQWVQTKKRELNLNQFDDTIGSPYSFLRNSQYLNRGW